MRLDDEVRPVGRRDSVRQRLRRPGSAVVIGGLPPSDRANPAAKRRRLSQILQPCERVHEDILDEVLGVLSRQSGDEHAMDGAAEALIQLAEGVAIPARGGRHHGGKILERQVVRKTPGGQRPLTDSPPAYSIR